MNPLCPSNDGVEGIEHFLLHCHSFEVPRSELLNSVSAILLPYGFSSLSNEVLLKYLLYDDESLAFDTNKKLPRQSLNSFKPLTAFKRFHCLLSYTLAPILTSCLVNHEALWLQG